MNKQISEEQGHRILEELQRIALSLNSIKNKAEMARLLATGADTDCNIIKENCDALGSNIQGMMNGNKKEKENVE